ncbi:hypothetical protein SprV_0501978300 [Sparganum proliferum]
MGKVEKTRLQDTINGLVFYGRYVDDIFCLADVTTDNEDLVKNFNSAHASLKFTAEAEAETGDSFDETGLALQRSTKHNDFGTGTFASTRPGL